jgi:hypothetical protein
MKKQVLAAAGVGVLVSCLGALVACGSPSAEEENAKSAAAALQSANVAIDLFDANGNKIGEGAGVLIAPNLVLTSGHLIAGKAKWTVTSADGKKTVNGTRGLTYDWMEYNSLKSHPRKHDVGVIYLDKAINLAAYPKIATTKQAVGADAKRVRHLGGNFEMVAAKLGKVRTFPHAYTTEMSNSETVNTGGAVVNDKGEIVGIVTGRGMQTSKLYIARTDGLAKWLSPKISCAGGKTDGLSVRTYSAPPPKPGCDAGTESSSGSSGASSGSSGASSSGSSGASSGGASSSGSSGASSSGASGSSGTDGTEPNPGGSCTDGDGVCTGDCSGTTGGGGTPGGGSSSGSSGSSGSDGTTPGSSSGSSGSSSGSSGASSSGASGSSGADGTTSGGASSSGASGSSGASSSGASGSSGTDGTTSGGASSSGASGSSGASSSGASGSSGTDGTTSSSGGSSGGVGDEEVCEGPSDNPDECPPEPNGCVGADCGGGAPDSTIDYGNCACSSSVGTGSLPVIR